MHLQITSSKWWCLFPSFPLPSQPTLDIFLWETMEWPPLTFHLRMTGYQLPFLSPACHLETVYKHLHGYEIIVIRQAESWTDRQTGRKLDRQTDRHTDRQTVRQTDMHTHTDRWKERQADKQTDKQTDRSTDWPTDRQTGRETDRQTDNYSYPSLTPHRWLTMASSPSVSHTPTGAHKSSQAPPPPSKMATSSHHSGTTMTFALKAQSTTRPIRVGAMRRPTCCCRTSAASSVLWGVWPFPAHGCWWGCGIMCTHTHMASLQTLMFILICLR